MTAAESCCFELPRVRRAGVAGGGTEDGFVNVEGEVLICKSDMLSFELGNPATM